MRVLLTGAAGFVGSTIAAALSARGDEVVGVDLMIEKAHGTSVTIPDGIVVGDVRDADVVRPLLEGIDVVCHQAAMVGLGVDASDAPDYASHNVLATAVLLAEMSAAGKHLLVQASSMVVYGEGGYSCPTHGGTRPPSRRPEDLLAGRFEPFCPACGDPLNWVTVTEDAALDPRNTYAASKLAQEHFGAAWAGQTASAVTSLRYHNVYGPGMPRDTPYAGVAAIFRSSLESGRPPQVFEDGGQMRDFVHVRDVAAANLAAIDRLHAAGGGRHGEVLACNVASGEPHTVGELATELALAIGGPSPEIVGGGRPGDVRHVVADPGLAARLLGHRAVVGFAEGVREFSTAPMRASAAR